MAMLELGGLTNCLQTATELAQFTVDVSSSSPHFNDQWSSSTDLQPAATTLVHKLKASMAVSETHPSDSALKLMGREGFVAWSMNDKGPVTLLLGPPSRQPLSIKLTQRWTSKGRAELG